MALDGFLPNLRDEELFGGTKFDMSSIFLKECQLRYSFFEKPHNYLNQ